MYSPYIAFIYLSKALRNHQVLHERSLLQSLEPRISIGMSSHTAAWPYVAGVLASDAVWVVSPGHSQPYLMLGSELDGRGSRMFEGPGHLVKEPDEHTPGPKSAKHTTESSLRTPLRTRGFLIRSCVMIRPWARKTVYYSQSR